ncbi:HesA/MoeB/ThiF family protein [Sediminibacterium sp.]|uniref:HesA/MoeB/ThiF family protein n=1 Tax=Sediminibacterium sp. TaxID=1917865 RepID=UPI002732DD05|nr:HesA/MoeB/ThiF family protein [Sediminibacterium sp.]MDP3392919.1 HesA/MoeB/ThiF family protein [Sediminibacterium sp.]MDP3567125.1 HesA/MoeB/ThiF family protein [Sediminibacterium sp.]
MDLNNRYIRQIILPGFGIAAQEKLGKAKVLIVGMGGLGCPVLQYLVGVGVGTIGIMDADKISKSNLHRQLLFDEKEVGRLKVEAAANKAKAQNSLVDIVEYPFELSKTNAAEIIKGYDLVIDATDNFSAKYLINDICVWLQKPVVFGAVSGYEGQVAVFNFSSGVNPPIHYRHLFPVQPAANEFTTCEETGVIGVLPGIIGTMQAAEAIKLIADLGQPLNNRLLTYNLLAARWYEIEMNSSVEVPLIDEQFINSTNYQNACDFTEADIEEMDIDEIDVFHFLDLKYDPNIFILDVRELHEYPTIDFSHAQIPMSVLKESIHQLPEKPIYVICHQGIRSVYAAQLIKLHKKVEAYSLKGGLTAYFNRVSNE